MPEPGHPSDEGLYALAEGTSQEAHDHVQGCGECRERVEAYRGAAAALACASPLSRQYCPPRETLYERASLAASDATRLQRHLDACPLCRADVRDLTALETAPGLVAVVRAELRLLAELGKGVLEVVESSLPSLPTPALATARGDSEAAVGIQVEAPFGGGTLVLGWAASERGVDLRAEVRGEATPAFRLELGPAGTDSEVWESRVAEAGVVSLRGIAPGRYTVRVYGPRSSEPELALDVELGEG
jgi:hypothetical protein